MKTFLKDFWLWILVPFLLVVVGVVGLWLAAGEQVNGFVYPIMGG